MKLKTSLYGVVLFSTAVGAYALDMRSTQPVAPASDAQATAPVNAAAVTNERIRQFFSQSGLDPDSDNGHLLMELFARVAADAEFRNKFSAFSQSRGMFGGQLSPDDRLRVLHLLKDLAQGPKSDCDALVANGRDFVRLAKTLSMVREELGRRSARAGGLITSAMEFVTTRPSLSSIPFAPR